MKKIITLLLIGILIITNNTHAFEINIDTDDLKNLGDEIRKEVEENLKELDMDEIKSKIKNIMSDLKENLKNLDDKIIENVNYYLENMDEVNNDIANKIKESLSNLDENLGNIDENIEKIVKDFLKKVPDDRIIEITIKLEEKINKMTEEGKLTDSMIKLLNGVKSLFKEESLKSGNLTGEQLIEILEM